MKVSELRLNDIKEVNGSIKSLKTKEIINKIKMSFDISSRKKLAKLFICNVVTPDVQNLYIEQLSVEQSGNELLTRGQSSYVDTKTGFVLFPQRTSPPHFEATFQAKTASTTDTQRCYDVEMNFGDFSFDFSTSEKIEHADKMIYKNVNLLIHPSDNIVKVLE